MAFSNRLSYKEHRLGYLPKGQTLSFCDMIFCALTLALTKRQV
jgi:hypothetical protein